MYSESEDFRSLWNLAHDWAGFDANKSDSENLPKQVYLNLQRLSSAILGRKLPAQTKKLQILIDDSIMTHLFDAKHFIKLLFCKWGRSLDVEYLKSIYIRRINFIEWCESERLPYSGFWVLTQVESPHKVNFRPKDENEDKAVCRAIALTLWEIDPNIHPSHLALSKAIQTYANGKLYNLETIKEWITDLDPQSKHRKTGRPPKVEYKIDLKMQSQADD